MRPKLEKNSKPRPKLVPFFKVEVWLICSRRDESSWQKVTEQNLYSNVPFYVVPLYVCWTRPVRILRLCAFHRLCSWKHSCDAMVYGRLVAHPAAKGRSSMHKLVNAFLVLRVHIFNFTFPLGAILSTNVMVLSDQRLATKPWKVSGVRVAWDNEKNVLLMLLPNEKAITSWCWDW